MTHLLDAHALIWSQDDPTRLGDAARQALRNQSHVLAVGIESIWEIGIKVAIGKLQLAKPVREWIDFAGADLGLVILPIALDHVERMVSLPQHHRDPFDRLLSAQALVEGLPIVGGDAQFDTYGVARIGD